MEEEKVKHLEDGIQLLLGAYLLRERGLERIKEQTN
jgi:hypothetical protein